jgi:hypothetical protein
MNQNRLSESELDLLSKYNLQNDSSNPILPKLVEHIIYNYNKLNRDNILLTQKNHFLYKEINNIIITNNRILFHFQLGLFLIVIIIFLHLYYVFT